jgi:hypothetical protein
MRVVFAAVIGLIAVAPGCASKQDCMPAPETKPNSIKIEARSAP